MAGTRVISIIGRKKSGKTTLIVALAAGFAKRQRKVGTIKHGHHASQLDAEGTDTWRHFNEGMARRVLLESPGSRALFERTDSESDPLLLARNYMGDCDIVIVEGFQNFAIPKIEVHRRDLTERPLFESASDDARHWVAMVTDDREMSLPIPVFRFNDTSWLVNLSHVAWEKATTLE